MKDLLAQANSQRETVTAYRRALHSFAECGFSLPKTTDFVTKALLEMGYEPQKYGKGGIVCEKKGTRARPVILLRADMDALPLAEKTALPFRAQNGCMHACGHDMHTAMLLLAARLLAARDVPLTVRFVFQAAEETLSGARLLCDLGVLKDVKAALMLHVIPAQELKVGTVFLPHGGAGAPAARFFSLDFYGESAHVGEAFRGKDALTAMLDVYRLLKEEAARCGEDLFFTVGSMRAGDAPNVVAENARMAGSFRSFDESKVAAFEDALFRIARAASASADIRPSILGAAPVLTNDENVACAVEEALLALDIPYLRPEGARSMAAEDFAHIASRVPATALAIAAGSPEDGYKYPLHHPKALFDEDVLPIGAAVYAASAMALAKDTLHTFTKEPRA